MIWVLAVILCLTLPFFLKKPVKTRKTTKSSKDPIEEALTSFALGEFATHAPEYIIMLDEDQWEDSR